MPSFPPLITRIDAQIVLLRLRDQNLRLLRQARHVRDTRPAGRDAVTISARASAHEAFSSARMDGLEADVARLPLCVLGARLGRYHYGLRVLHLGMKFLGAACFFNLFAELVMATLFPVLFLAGRPAVTRLATAALFG